MLIVITTFPNKPKAIKEFCYALIGSKLAKCVNRVNYVKSYFFWEGKIQNQNEVLLIIKTKKENIDKLTKYIESKHPYDTPEIVTLSPQEVNKKYLDWIKT